MLTSVIFSNRPIQWAWLKTHTNCLHFSWLRSLILGCRSPRLMSQEQCNNFPEYLLTSLKLPPPRFPWTILALVYWADSSDKSTKGKLKKQFEQHWLNRRQVNMPECYMTDCKPADNMSKLACHCVGMTRGKTHALGSAVQCNIPVQCNVVLCSAAHRSAVQCSALQCSAVQCSALGWQTVSKRAFLQEASARLSDSWDILNSSAISEICSFPQRIRFS